MNTQISVIQSDFGYNLNFTLQDSQGNIFSLSGASSLFFRAQKSNTTQLKFSSAMTIDSSIQGTCHYTVNAGDFDSAGQYTAEIQVNFGSSETVTFSNITVIAASRVPF